MKDQEVDKDLTMLGGGEPTPGEDAFKKAVEDIDIIGTTAPAAPTNEKEWDQAVVDQDIKNQFESSFRTGSVDPGLDAGQSMFEDTNSVRARNQSEFIKGIKAVGGGIAQGGLIALEQAGYVADLDTYTNMFKETEDLSGNWWTRLMKESQEGLRESEAFKIYESTPDENSLGSQIFKWSALEGAMSSAVGFGVTGLGAAKLVSWLGSMKKFKEMAAFTDATLGNMTGKSLTGWTGEKAGPLATSMISNYFMGQMMATDTYNQTMKELAPLIGTGENQITPKEAQTRAAANAQDVVGLNMALTATSYLRFGSIFKRKGKIKGLVENPSLLNQTKNLIKTGSPTAFTENVYQEMIQMEQIEDTKQELGAEGEYSKNYWDRMANLALSNRALHAGALGIAGGPMQFAMIQVPMTRGLRAEQKKTYKGQQDAIKWHADVAKNKFDKTVKLENMINEAVASGKTEDAEFISSITVLDELADTLDWGITGHLRKSIEDIRDLSPEEAAAPPYSYDADYKENAEKFLETIDQAEHIASNHSDKANRGEIMFNVLSGKAAFDTTVKLSTESVRLRQEAIDKAAASLGVESSSIDPVTLLFKEAIGGDSKALNKSIKASYEYKQHLVKEKDIAKYKKFMADLNDQYDKITSDAYQKKYEKTSGKEGVDKLNKTMEEAESDAKEAAAVEKKANYGQFSEAKKASEAKAKEETAEQKTAREKRWKEDQKDESGRLGRSLPTTDTFTYEDRDRNSQQFTRGDIRRTKDSETYYKVLGQAGASGKDVGVGKGPLLQEVEFVDGKWKNVKGDNKNPFILTTNDWLRPEALQELYADQNKYGKVWAEYMKPDSFLKPNNAIYQSGRVRYLEAGEAKTINISARELRDNDYTWLDEYDTVDNDLPFKGKYPIEYKKDTSRGDNDTIIDVYKRGTDTKIARIDRTYNHNFALISEALIDGPVYGEVVAHFSSNENVNTNLDGEGNKIYSSIEALKNMNPAQLPNGELILASKKGRDGIEVASSMTSGPIKGGVININGVDKRIPFHKFTPGDVYALILSPQNELMQVATSSKNVGEILEPDGKTFVDSTIIPSIQESIKFIHGDYLANEKANDAKLWARVKEDNNLNTDISIDNEGNPVYDIAAKKAFRKLKIIELAKSRKAFEKHLLKGERDKQGNKIMETVYDFIRPGFYKKSQRTSAGNVTYEKGKNGKLKVSDNYFEVTYDVSMETLKVVPAVNVVDKRNPYVKDTKKKKRRFDSGGKVRYNLVDNYDQFMEEVGKKRLRLSTEDISAPVVEGKTNTIQDIIKRGIITTDINPKNPFVGSSLTTTIEGADIATKASAMAARLKKGLTASDKKAVASAPSSIKAQTTEELTETFESKVSKFLDPNSEGLNIVEFSAGTEAEIQQSFQTFLRGLRINESGEVRELAEKIFNEVPTESDQLEIDKRVSDLRDIRIAEDKVQFMGKLYYALDMVSEFVATGEFTLKSTKGKSTYTKATPEYTQPDGDIQFNSKATVYHPVFGESTVLKRLSNRKYRIKDKKGKAHTVLPSTVMEFQGPSHLIELLDAEIDAMDKSDSKYDKKVKDRKSLENKRTKLRRENGLAVSDTNDTGTVASNGLALDYYAKAASGRDIEFLEKLNQHQRSNQLGEATSTIQAVKDEIGTEGVIASLEDAQAVVEGLKEANIYKQQDLERLHKQAKDTGDIKSMVTIEVLMDVNDTLENMTEAQLTGNNPLALETVAVTRINRETGELGTVARFIDMPHGGNPLSTKSHLRTFANDYSIMLLEAVRAETVLTTDMFSEKSKPTEPEVTPKKKDEVVIEEFTKKPEVAVEDIAEISDLSPTDKAAIKALNPEQKTKWLADYNRDKGTMAGTEVHLKMLRMMAEQNTGTKFKEGTEASMTPEKFAAEVRHIKEMLPQVPLEVVGKMTDMYNKFGKNALGAYSRGVRYLVQQAKAGTGYHETFHAVAGLYLRSFERQQIAEEYGHQKWNDKLEEQLADEFAAYVSNRNKKRPLKKLTDKVKSFFRGIIDWATKTRSADVTTRIFEKIATGGYAQNANTSILNEIGKGFSTIEEFSASLSDDNRVLLQELVNNDRIKIVC